MTNDKTKCFIHIGTHKTGTSALQAFCWKHRKVLFDLGVDYPDTGIYGNGHHVLSHKWGGWLNTKKLNSNPEEQWDKLSRYISTKPDTKIVISSERFTGLGISGGGREAISYIANKLDTADVKIIGYIRRQDEFAESIFKQGVRGNSIRSSIDDFIENLPGYFDYYKMFKNWAEVFGHENIDVRIFEPVRFPDGNLIKDFFNAIDIVIPDQLANRVEHRNASMSATAVLLMTDRYLKPYLNDDKFRSAVKKSLGQVKMEENSQNFVLKPKQRKKIMEMYEESNLELCTHFLGKNDLKYFSGDSNYSHASFNPRSRDFNYYHLRKVIKLLLDNHNVKN